MVKLSVNVNKLATLRNARGKNCPDVLQMALDIVAYGAEGITVHPRPDGRHIRKQDVFDLADALPVELNIEGYPDDDFLDLVTQIRPAQCTLVPDPPHVLTSNAGWQIAKNFDLLQNTITTLHHYTIRTSVFVDPYHCTAEDIACIAALKTDRVELYTAAYADTYGGPEALQCLSLYKKLGLALNNVGIALNAGHDLNLDNLAHFLQEIPSIQEVSIGHALICDALQYGMRETIALYLACLRK